MAKFTSRYPELTFYVDGVAKRFTNGTYETDDKATQDVLKSLTDVKAEPKAEEAKPAEKPKPAAKAKPSGK